MPRSKQLRLARDWIFDRMVSILNGQWTLEVKDLRKSRDKDDRWSAGITDHEDQVITLDQADGSERVLVHELGHVLFDPFLEEEARLAVPYLGKNKKTQNERFGWTEDRIHEFEEYFYNSLLPRQLAILRTFIREARDRNKNKA